MLQQSMIEKLHALMLRVTIAALKQQEQDEGSRLVARTRFLPDVSEPLALSARFVRGKYRLRAERGLNRSVIGALAQSVGISLFDTFVSGRIAANSGGVTIVVELP
jgi:hypothetical protein